MVTRDHGTPGPAEAYSVSTPWNFPSEAATGAWEGVLRAADSLVHELPSVWVFVPLVLEATVCEFPAPSGTCACLQPPHPDKPGRRLRREGLFTEGTCLLPLMTSAADVLNYGYAN